LFDISTMLGQTYLRRCAAALTRDARVAAATASLPPRTAMFVPGSNARALAKAPTLGVDAVILDLEDAVPPTAKAEARDRIAAAVKSGAFAGTTTVVVRVNSLRTAPQWGAADLEMCAALGDAIHAVAVPKVELGDEEDVLSRLPPGQKLWGFFETPRGIFQAPDICASGVFSTVAMGNNDLSAELQLPLSAPQPGMNIPRRFGLQWAMSAVVMAARTSKVPVLDGVFNDPTDRAGFAAECLEGRMMGFDGKTLIHPAQVEPATRAFSPSTHEVAWAECILSAVDKAAREGNIIGGAFVVNGRMVEELHVRRAAQIVAASQRK
jgi:citrate lyase subunit beta/citryl-CoA lyase